MLADTKTKKPEYTIKHLDGIYSSDEFNALKQLTQFAYFSLAS